MINVSSELNQIEKPAEAIEPLEITTGQVASVEIAQTELSDHTPSPEMRVNVHVRNPSHNLKHRTYKTKDEE